MGTTSSEPVITSAGTDIARSNRRSSARRAGSP